MQAAVLAHPGTLHLVERPEPDEPGVGEALVAVHRVGICGTDHHAYAGKQNFFAYPRVLGHELAVEVLAVGPEVDDLEVGARCAAMPYVSCGTCGACRRGRTNACERIDVVGVTCDGGLCERLVLPARQLFRGDGLSLDQLVLVETLGIGWHAVARAGVQAGDACLVLGAGPIGLGIAQSVLARDGAVVIADVAPERVAFARGAGLDALVVADGFPEALLDQGRGVLPAVVFDATGNRGSMERAVSYAGAGGTVVYVGHTTADIAFHNPTFHRRELDLRGSRNATVQDWHEVLAAVRSGALDAVGWINHRTSLPGIVDELAGLAASPGSTVKTVVDIGPSGRMPGRP